MHVNRSHLRWTFEDFIMGMHDWFVHPSTMQDMHQNFLCAKYTLETGIQGYYDVLMDHAYNIAVHPDGYQLMERFLCGIPADICESMGCPLRLILSMILLHVSRW